MAGPDISVHYGPTSQTALRKKHYTAVLSDVERTQAMPSGLRTQVDGCWSKQGGPNLMSPPQQIRMQLAQLRMWQS